MRYPPTVTAIVIDVSMMSCMRTTSFSSEYSQQYYLREDVNKYSTPGGQ